MRSVSFLTTVALAMALSGCGDSLTEPQRAAPKGGPAFSTGSALTVTSLICYDVGGGGVRYNETQCFAETSGGAGGNTYTWDVIVNHQGDGPNSSYIEGVCSDSYPVSITVQDVAGATAYASGTFQCYAKSTGDGGLEP